MTDGLTIDTGATTQLAAGFSAAAAKLGDPADLLREIAARVGADASTRAPRATGAMAGSMTAHGATVDGLPAVELTWGARYAAYVNFGTSRMAARPFATDALAAAAGDAAPLMAQWADTIINTI